MPTSVHLIAITIVLSITKKPPPPLSVLYCIIEEIIESVALSFSSSLVFVQLCKE